MYNLRAVFISMLSIVSLAAAVPRTKSRWSRQVARQEGQGKIWNQVDKYQGDSFLDGWDFFDQSDPTNGAVNYQNAESAKAKGLAVVKDGQIVLSVDDTTELPLGAKRDSVRISTKKTYTGGLFIADFAAMPFGCSVWPAWWSVGPNWPSGGEIDVLEGVHNQDTNQYTLHTSPGCTLDRSVKTTSKVLGTQCESSGSNNNGCAFRDTDPRSYGQGFNSVGGGVYAHIWDNTGIRMWHFARSEIPQDITDGKPNPATWPTPAANFATSTCDMAAHFHDHVLTIDTTLCGDWAGATYRSVGCPGSCEEAVADSKNFAGAKWKINYIAVYN